MKISRGRLFVFGLIGMVIAGTLFAALYERAADQVMRAEVADELTWYRSSQFEKLLVGKTKQEVVALLGTPLSTHSLIGPRTQAYSYSPGESYLGPVKFRVVDDLTGLTQRFVSIHFDEAGYATGVQY